MSPFQRSVGWLMLLMGVPAPAIAQQDARPLGELAQNVPNPFSSKTAIGFEILPVACGEGHRPRVTIHVLNVLVQVVAVPVLGDSSGAALEDLVLDCGRYLATWNRALRDDGRLAPPGSYFYRLFVDGAPQAVRLMQIRQAPDDEAEKPSP